MAILQFAFGNDPQAPTFKPHNYVRDLVAYTGTHDNDTAVGWWNSGGTSDSTRTPEDVAKEHAFARAYLGFKDAPIHWVMIRAVHVFGRQYRHRAHAGYAWPGHRGTHEPSGHPRVATGNGACKPGVANRRDRGAAAKVGRLFVRPLEHDRWSTFALTKQVRARGPHMDKPTQSFWQIWNMSFGFFGIQFGWGLQMANMSAIYEYLGARADQIPILWLAAPLTGLIVQPIIGHASDHTWGRLGRRRPYFLTGAILSSCALILMPRSAVLWMAAGLLWILDASINISMEPFRAFVADLLPEQQRTRGFAMQSLFIGLGAVVASSLPWMLTNWFHLGAGAAGHAIPFTVRLSFYIGAAVFLAAVLWTIATTKEYPPEDMEAFRRMKSEKRSLGTNAAEILDSIATMPKTMRQLAPVQF